MSPIQHQRIAVLFLVSSIFGSVFATQATERTSNAVELTFYQLSASEWTSTLSTFKTTVAAEAATYCGNNAATCGLVSGFLFTSTEIGVGEGPTVEGQSTKVKVYIDFPTVKTLDASSTTTFVVNSAAVKTILTTVMDAIEGGVGHEVTYIGSDFYGIAPAAAMNKAIIPIAFILLFAIIGLAIGLHMWNKKKEQAAKKKLMIEKRSSKKGRVRPVLTMENDKQPGNFWPKRSKKKKAVGIKMEKEALEDNDADTPRPLSKAQPNGSVPTLSLKTNVMTFDSKQGADKDAPRAALKDRASARANSALPPLEGLSGEAEKKERRRRRREKKRAEKEAAGEEYVESESEKSKSETCVIPVENDAPVIKGKK